MSVLSLIGILFALVVIIPHSTTAIKCFRCRSESECDSDYNFRSDIGRTDSRFIDERCSNPNYIPACKYVINNKSVVLERGCGDIDVTSRQPFCKNKSDDVVECYCTTDRCNGIDASNTAINAAEEHFRRQGGVYEKENEVKNAATSRTLNIFWMALIMIFSSICG